MTLERRTPLKRSRIKPKPHEDPWTAEVRAAVRTRSGGRCELQLPGCGGTRPMTKQSLHHRKHRRYGDHSAENAIGVCSNCHTAGPGAIHREVAAAKENGWIVSEWDDPVEVVWLAAGGAWVAPRWHGASRASDDARASIDLASAPSIQGDP